MQTYTKIDNSLTTIRNAVIYQCMCLMLYIASSPSWVIIYLAAAVLQLQGLRRISMEDPCNSMCSNIWYFCRLLCQMVLWSIPECISGGYICLIQSSYDMSARGSSPPVPDRGQLRMPISRLSWKSHSRNMQMIQVWGNGPWIFRGFVQN